MAEYSKKSLEMLGTCHVDLQHLFLIIVKDFDNTILQGHRGEEDQNRAYDEGKSQLQWPDGNHNELPSLAVDAAPYPIDWNDRVRMSYFAGRVVGLGLSMGMNIRWGGDWDQDTELKDNSFDDLVHFELIL